MKEESINDQVQIYFKEDLNLKSNVPGAMMWTVGLEKSMMTYFEESRALHSLRILMKLSRLLSCLKAS